MLHNLTHFLEACAMEGGLVAPEVTIELHVRLFQTLEKELAQSCHHYHHVNPDLLEDGIEFRRIVLTTSYGQITVKGVY